jgi:hypothetical protein
VTESHAGELFAFELPGHRRSPRCSVVDASPRPLSVLRATCSLGAHPNGEVGHVPSEANPGAATPAIVLARGRPKLPRRQTRPFSVSESGLVTDRTAGELTVYGPGCLPRRPTCAEVDASPRLQGGPRPSVLSRGVALAVKR